MRREASRPSPARRSKTRCAAPRLRLLCFTNAGHAENIYTNEGLGARRVAVLLEWCRANAVELLAVQPPGRGARAKEPFLPDAQARARRRPVAACTGPLTQRCPAPQAIAAHVVRLVASRLADAPYCIIGHSVGTWIAFETLSLAREQGLPMPLKACDVAARLGSSRLSSCTAPGVLLVLPRA